MDTTTKSVLTKTDLTSLKAAVTGSFGIIEIDMTVYFRVCGIIGPKFTFLVKYYSAINSAVIVSHILMIF